MAKLALVGKALEQAFKLAGQTKRRRLFGVKLGILNAEFRIAINGLRNVEQAVDFLLVADQLQPLFFADLRRIEVGEVCAFGLGGSGQDVAVVHH